MFLQFSALDFVLTTWSLDQRARGNNTPGLALLTFSSSLSGRGGVFYVMGFFSQETSVLNSLECGTDYRGRGQLNFQPVNTSLEIRAIIKM